MKSEASELVVRAAALYLPITIGLAFAILRRPDRRRIAGAVVAVVWNLAALLVLNILAQHFGWWTFSTSGAVVAGTPVELWVGWALLWGAVPLVLNTDRFIIVGLALFAADLVLMPLAAPVVSLDSTWLLGEVICVATSLVPGLLLGRWTALDSHVTRRTTLQIIAFSGLLLFVLPSLIFTVTGEDWTTFVDRPRWQFLLAALVAAPAGAMALQAVYEFANAGNGTPVPLDPPRRLVVTGPYAFVANPMQIGGSFILAEWGVLVGSPAVFAAAIMGALFSAGVAAWNESGELLQRFGSDWTRYRAEVRTWLPRWRPYTSTSATVFVGTSCEPCSEVRNFLANRRSRGLVIAAAEGASEELTRITYRAGGIGTATGIAALGRSVEHVNLAWAVSSWIVRLPLICPFLQLVADAVGAGPRRLGLVVVEADQPHSSIDRSACTPHQRLHGVATVLGTDHNDGKISGPVQQELG
jgi:protein-S-isoprenylcysteine O-methyltransferase Ste14